MIHAAHAIHALTHARVVLQALPVATLPAAFNVMIRQFAGRRRFVFNGDPEVERRFSELPASERAEHEVLQGHMHFGIDRYLPEQALYLTMLRDPVECAIAFYYMVLSSPGHYLHPHLAAGNWSIEDLVIRKRPEIDNPQVRWLNPVPDRRMPFGTVTREMLDHAKRAIEERYLFGLAERLDESLLLFQKSLGWSDVSYTTHTMLAQRPLREGVAPDTVERLREINQFDEELYRHAAPIFEQRLAALGAGFDAELAAFRETNRLKAQDSIWVAGQPISTTPPPELEPAQDVVWLASYPRSGNTWLRFLLDTYFFPAARFMQEVGRLSGELDWWVQEAKRLNLSESWIAYAGHEVRQRYPRPAGCPADLFLKSHYVFSEQHPLRARSRAAIYLIRDPRDVLLSGMNFADLTNDAAAQGDQAYALSFAAAGGDQGWLDMGYGTWAAHAESWLGAKDFPVLLVRYEDLKADAPAQLRKILEFIGAPIDEDRLMRSVELCSLSRLRNLEVASRATTALPSLKKKDKFFFHKGLTGQSLAHLGPEVQAAFQQTFAGPAARWGYSL